MNAEKLQNFLSLAESYFEAEKEMLDFVNEKGIEVYKVIIEIQKNHTIPQWLRGFGFGETAQRIVLDHGTITSFVYDGDGGERTEDIDSKFFSDFKGWLEKKKADILSQSKDISKEREAARRAEWEKLNKEFGGDVQTNTPK